MTSRGTTSPHVVISSRREEIKGSGDMHDDRWTTSKDENIFQMYVAHGGPEAPDWAGSANLRPLDDPRLDAALAQLDRKRYKAPGIAHANDKARVRLNVTY